MLQPLFLLLTVAFGQNAKDDLKNTFNVNLNTPSPIQANGQISITWTYVTCAGVLNSNGRLVLKPTLLNGICLDEGGNPAKEPTDLSTVFPRGFTRLTLNRLSDDVTFDLLKGVKNNALLVAQTKALTFGNLGQYTTDYYSVSLLAEDALGNFVRGQTPLFVIQNNGQPPKRDIIKVYSPLPGTFWVANSQYRIRFEMPESDIKTFHVDLLAPRSDIVLARLKEAEFPIINDFLFGPNRPLLYFLWKVDKALANRSYRLRITATKLEGDRIVDYTPETIIETGVFTIGPAIPENKTWY